MFNNKKKYHCSHTHVFITLRSISKVIPMCSIFNVEALVAKPNETQISVCVKVHSWKRTCLYRKASVRDCVETVFSFLMLHF